MIWFSEISAQLCFMLLRDLKPSNKIIKLILIISSQLTMYQKDNRENAYTILRYNLGKNPSKMECAWVF